MAVYAQHGYGKTTKVEKGLTDEAILGAVLSLRDEKPDSMVSFVEQLRESYPDSFFMVDPQFYISMYSPARDTKLRLYRHYESGRRESDFASGKRVRSYVKETIDIQAEMDVDVLVAPTVHVEGIDDRTYQIALSLANESMDYRGSMGGEDRDLYLSFVLSEHVFNQPKGVDEFLDLVTTWDISGIYLIVDRPVVGYSQRFEPRPLANLMYATHVLGAVNEIDVVCGYTDVYGILLRAAGASAIASGWSQGCRRHHRPAFLDRDTQARRPRDRYLSTPLLNSVLIAELDLVDDVGELEGVLSGTQSDALLTAASTPGAATWDALTPTIQHWEALSILDNEITGEVASDLDRIVERIDSAKLLYTDLQDLGVRFSTGPRGTDDAHLADWAEAIQLFRTRAGL